MIFNNINEKLLEFIFKRLRNQEGISVGFVTSKLKPFQIFKILVNVKFKKDKNTILTEFEKIVLEESGKYIPSYVFQKYEEQTKIKTFNELPYQDFANKTLKDFNINFISKLYNKTA